MNETSFAAPEIAASRQRGVPADDGELWKILRIDAERAAAGEEMLRDFLDLTVLRHNGFTSGLGLLLARKLAEYSMPAQRLGEIARAAMAGDPGIIAAAIAGESLRISCKAACPRFLPSISIPPWRSGAAYLSTTVPVS